MQKSNKPDSILYLPRELFNTLIKALDYFIAAENEIGATTQTQQAVRLKEKILTHARAFNHKEEANASIYLYGVEAVVLLKLITIYINLGEFPDVDYFNQLQYRKSKMYHGGWGFIPTSAEQNGGS